MGWWKNGILAENASDVIKVQHLPRLSFGDLKAERGQLRSQACCLDAFVEILTVDVLPESGCL